MWKSNFKEMKVRPNSPDERQQTRLSGILCVKTRCFLPSLLPSFLPSFPPDLSSAKTYRSRSKKLSTFGSVVELKCQCERWKQIRVSYQQLSLQHQPRVGSDWLERRVDVTPWTGQSAERGSAQGSVHVERGAGPLALHRTCVVRAGTDSEHLTVHGTLRLYFDFILRYSYIILPNTLKPSSCVFVSMIIRERQRPRDSTVCSRALWQKIWFVVRAGRDRFEVKVHRLKDVFLINRTCSSHVKNKSQMGFWTNPETKTLLSEASYTYIYKQHSQWTWVLFSLVLTVSNMEFFLQALQYIMSIHYIFTYMS